MAEGYTSTVVAPAQIALGVVSGAVLAIVIEVISSGLWPLAVLGFLVAVGAGVYLATIELSVTRRRITISQGRGDRQPRFLDTAEIVESRSENLSWPQCFGIGVPAGVTTTRLSVRPGPTLCLTLSDGELVRISTPDPQAALDVLASGSRHAA